MVIRAEADACQSSGAGNEEIQTLKLEMNAIKTTRTALINERNAFSTRIKELKGTSDSIKTSEKALRSEVKFTNMKDIEEEIGHLTYQQETQSMTLQEEKKLIKEIESLKSSKKIVMKFASERGNMDKCMGSLKEVRAMHDGKNIEVDVISKAMNEKKKLLDAAYAVLNIARDSNPFPKLMEERKKQKAELDILYNSLRSARTTFKDENDVYFTFIRAQREARKEEEKVEAAVRQSEYEVQMAEYNMEMSKIHPYQDEMDLCDALTTYMVANFTVSTLDKATPAAVSNVTVELDGMKPLLRKEEDFMFMGKKDKKGGKKKGPKAKKMSLPIVQMESYSKIGLLPPFSADKVADSIIAIGAAKASFLTKTSRDGKKNETVQSKPSSSDAGKKGKKSSKFDVQKMDFPTLGDCNNAGPSGSWGPGPVADAASPEEFPLAEPVTSN